MRRATGDARCGWSWVRSTHPTIADYPTSKDRSVIAGLKPGLQGEHGGLETARILINSPKVSDGYTTLWELGRLDITVEALIHDNAKYQELFTKEELKTVRKRLADYQYKPAKTL